MNTKQLNQKNKLIWNINASEWNLAMGEGGNNWHKELIAPTAEKLLNLSSGNNLLDVGCGNGVFSRRMAQKGVNVCGIDFSYKNIKEAKKYDAKNINYKVLDASIMSDLQKLKKNSFNGIVSNMVLMDMPDIEPFFSMINCLLIDNGVFVFSIQHPCFNSEYTKLTNDNQILISDYIDKGISKGIAIQNQPEEQFYFHRPISYYMNLGFSNNLAVNGFTEPTFECNIATEVYNRIPPILFIRMTKK